MDVQQAPAGWYPDAEVPGWVRWWDGREWTERRGPPAPRWGPPAPLPAVPPDRFDLPGGQAKVGFGEAISLGFRQYARFSGRASRSEYWWWFLFMFVVLAATYVPGAVDTANRTSRLAELCAQGSSTACTEDPSSLWLLLPLAWLLVVGLPSIAVAVRRLHDTGKSGAWYVLVVAPFGSIVVLVLLALEPSPGPNRYGMPPTKGRPALAGVDFSRPPQLG